MSMEVSISGSSNEIDRAIAVLGSPVRVNKAISQGALPVVQNHFRGLAATNHNRFGVRSSFWNRMLAATKGDATAEAAIVRMPGEIALRFFGGTVTPKKAKFLAIPARAEAYGKSPRDFTDLRFAVLPEGGPVLIRVVKKSGKSGKDIMGGEVMYWLRRQATIRANSEVLPTEAELQAGAVRGLEALLKANQGGS